ncbi:hypothetical protein [Nocardia brasiliensis]|uniref:hypothetical protein n=1 Tax=Nocardia brasiliensis TaxID=37326 RepID=UPI0004A6EA96|nr:hypothetical protein [Nocardia brasiliensis]
MTENADVSSETPPQRESPAAIAARDSLLYSIANEAKQVSKSQAGNASAALVELARAYALTTARLLVASGQVIEVLDDEFEGGKSFQTAPGLVILARRGRYSEHLDGITDVASMVWTASPAVTAARDELLYAIGREAVIVAKDQAGSASAALVALARACALVSAATVVTPSSRNQATLIVTPA